MIQTDELVANYVRHADVDYVGLWQIVARIREDLGIHDDGEVRVKSLEVVRGLLERGLYPGDYLKAGFRFWNDKSVDRVLARIDREWKAQKHDPGLVDPICWFDRRASPRG
jgi:hypothetical protein